MPWQKMFPLALFFVFLCAQIRCVFNAPTTDDDQFTFCPIVAELAQKMVDECVEEYRKMVEQRPHIKGISGRETPPHPISQNGQQQQQNEFEYSWITFHAILRKIVMRNSAKNYRQIANRCQQLSDEPSVSLFCDFVNCVAFVKRSFEQLKKWEGHQTTKNLVEEKVAEEMFKRMEIAGKIGREKVLAGKKLVAQNLPMIAEATDGKKAQRISIKFGHAFVPVDKQWAGHVLAGLLDNCKMYVFDVDNEHTFRNAFQMANISIKTVLLQRPTTTNSSSNQTDIDETCAVLYATYPRKDLCLFAKKLAYLSVLSRAVSIPTGALGCWPMKRDRSKAVRDCVMTLRKRYDAERDKMANYWLDELDRQHFLAEFAFERQAKAVEEALEVME